MPAGSQGDFLKYAAEVVGDTAFGHHLAQQADPRRAGLTFYAGSSARTLGETLAVFLRYASLVNESLHLATVSQPVSVIVEFSFVGVSPQRVKQDTEFWTVMIVKA